jgi:hypothetical protein
MQTTTDLNELADHLPAKRLGEVLRRARWSAGLSCAEVATATTDLMPIKLLGAIERGRRRPTAAQLDLLDSIYDADFTTKLGTARVVPVLDLGTGLLELGTHRVHLLTTDSRQVLSQYVDLISLVRGTRTGDLRFRIEDVEVLGTSLGRSRRSIQADLRALLRGDIALTDTVEVSGDSNAASIEAHPAEASDDAHEAQLVPLEIPAADGPRPHASLDRVRLVELDAVRDALYAAPSLRDRLVTKSTRTDRQQALRTRQRELLGELGFTTWSSMLIAIARAEASVPSRDPEKFLALNPGPPTS